MIPSFGNKPTIQRHNARHHPPGDNHEQSVMEMVRDIVMKENITHEYDSRRLMGGLAGDYSRRSYSSSTTPQCALPPSWQAASERVRVPHENSGSNKIIIRLDSSHLLLNKA
jgi:hypothetical protein